MFFRFFAANPMLQMRHFEVEVKLVFQFVEQVQ